MGKRLLSYPPTAEDEAESLRQALTDANIDFYETPASRFGISYAAIWVEKTVFPQAEAVLKQHMISYSEHARQQYQNETGYQPNAPLKQQFSHWLHHIAQRKALTLLALVGFVLVGVYLYAFFEIFY